MELEISGWIQKLLPRKGQHQLTNLTSHQVEILEEIMSDQLGLALTTMALKDTPAKEVIKVIKGVISRDSWSRKFKRSAGGVERGVSGKVIFECWVLEATDLTGITCKWFWRAGERYEWIESLVNHLRTVVVFSNKILV